MKPVIGVLGGLGPKTTAEFYLKLVELGTRTVRPGVCIWSLPLNLRKECGYIRQGLHIRYYFSLLHAGALALVRAGATKLVIPCNTVHEFHSHLVARMPIPVTNLIQVVAQEVHRRGWREIFLMATSRTIQTRLYQEVLGKLGIAVITPQAPDQIRLDGLIQGLLGDQQTTQHQEFLKQMVIESPTRNIVLGCTDLRLQFEGSENRIDSMEVLAEHTAQSFR